MTRVSPPAWSARNRTKSGGAGAGIVLGDNVGVHIGQDVERFGDMTGADQQLGAGRAVAQGEVGEGVELAASAEALRLDAEILPRGRECRAQQIALRHRLAG